MYRFSKSILLFISMFVIYTLPVVADAPIFSGDVEADFVGPGVVIIEDPGEIDVTMPPSFPTGSISGNDIKDVRFFYDSDKDILSVGINTYLIAGDVDGNDNPGGTGVFLDDLGGVDLPDFSGTESFALSIDIDEDGIFDVIAGVSAATDTSGYSVNLFSGNPHIPEFAFGQPLAMNKGTLFASPSATAPDVEFTILDFSTLPYSSSVDATPHRVGINLFMGSFADSGIGEDFLPAVTGISNLPVGPGIEIIKAPTEPIVEEGEVGQFDVTVINGGNSLLRDILIIDEVIPDCEKDIQDLEIGESATYRCELVDIRSDIASTIVVEAFDGEGNRVTAEGEATIMLAGQSYFLETTINGEGADSLATAFQTSAEDTLLVEYTLHNTGNTPIEWAELRDNIFGNLNECITPSVIIQPNESASCEIRSQAKDTATGEEHIGTAILKNGETTSNSAWYQTPSQNNFVFSTTVNDEDANTLADRLQVKPGDLLTFRYDLFNNGNIPLFWEALTDDVMGDLSAGCNLPRVIDPDGGAFCELSLEAEDAPTGRRNIGSAMIKGFLPATDVAWYQTPEDASYIFRQTVNGRDANTQDEAVGSEVGNLLTFRYSIFNDGNMPLVWQTLNDNSFGDLTGECGLPKDVPVDDSIFCEILRPAGNFSGGKQQMGTAEVEGLVSQNDSAWYKTELRPEYSFVATINGQDVDTVEDALLAQADELLMFRYVVINNGNIPIEWTALNDNIFDQIVNLSEQCQLPQIIAVGGSAVCNVPYQAQARPEGEEHISRVTVADLDPQQNSVWYQTAIIPRYTFEKTINGLDANTLESAVQVNYQAPVTFRYSLINNGNVPIDWIALDDEIFGDIGYKCNLPKRILPGGGSFCETTSFSRDFPDGSANLSTVQVEGLEDKSDAAWYQTPLLVDYLYKMSINFRDADTLENAAQAKYGEMLRFRYQVRNRGNKVMVWNSIEDDIHGDLSIECQLPKEIGVGGTAFCDILRPAETSPGGQEHVSHVDVQIKERPGSDIHVVPLDFKNDRAWYRTQVIVPGNPDFAFETKINGMSADSLEDAAQTAPNTILTIEYIIINSGDVSIEWAGLSDDVYGNLIHDCELPRLVEAGADSTCSIRRAAGEFRQGKRHVGAAAVSGLGVKTDEAWYLSATEPDYTLKLSINSQDADTVEEAVQVRTGLELEYTYEVINLGNEELLWRKLNDTVLGDLTDECDILPTYIPIGGSASCNVLRPAQRSVDGQEHVAQATVAQLAQKTDSTWYQTGGSEGSVGGFVWEDANKNGIQEPDELGLPKVIVELVDAFTNRNIESLLTDENGNYLFTGIAPGNYRLKVIPRSPRAIFGPATETDNTEMDSNVNPDTGYTELITLKAGDFIDTIDAGIIGEIDARLAALGDLVWEDQNGNGIREVDELPIPNIEVTLLDSAKMMIGQTTTDEAGRYFFTELHPGTYYIRFTIPEEYGVSPANRGLNDNVDTDIFLEPDGLTAISDPLQLKVAQINVGVDAGLYLPVQLNNSVWEDMNGNGVHEQSEPGLENVQVSLRRRGAPEPIEVTRTADDGNYTFEDMAPGEYFLVFEEPEGYGFTEYDPITGEPFEVRGQDANPLTGVTPPLNIVSPEEVETVHAGLLRPAILGGVTWEDENNNGLQEEDEELVSGVAIQVIDDEGAVVEVVESDENGEYVAAVKPGIYNLLCVPMPGVEITPPDQGENDLIDSDFDPVSGLSAPIELLSGQFEEATNVGLVFSTAAIAIDKRVQGEDADEPSGPVIPVGTDVRWTYEVRNVGTEPLTDIHLVDDLLGEITSCPGDSLKGGEFMLCTEHTLAVAGTQSSAVQVTALVNGNQDKTVEDNDTNHYTGFAAPVDLEITVSDDYDPADAGRDIIYTVIYTNHGPGDAQSITIEDQLPVGVILNEVLEAMPSLESPRVSFHITRGMSLLWTLPELKAGESGSIQLQLETDSDLVGETVTNTVSIGNIIPEENDQNNLAHEETTFRNIRSFNPTEIELLSLAARPAPDSIEIRWVTGAEVDTKGFEIYRNAGNNRPEAVPVTPKLIISAGPHGNEYKFIDRTALSSVDYTYWLVEVENDGTENEYDPITATIEIAGQQELATSDSYFIYLPMILK